MAAILTDRTGQQLADSMRQLFTVLVAVLLPMSAFSDDTAHPVKPEVARFVDNAEACDHLAGEWDPDMTKKEKRVIERGIDKYCGTAQKQRAGLLKKYKTDAAVMTVLNKYDSVKDYTRVR